MGAEVGIKCSVHIIVAHDKDAVSIFRTARILIFASYMPCSALQSIGPWFEIFLLSD